MKKIITAIAIIAATITYANAQDKEAHCFKAAELEIEADAIKMKDESERTEALGKVDKHQEETAYRRYRTMQRYGTPREANRLYKLAIFHGEKAEQ